MCSIIGVGERLHKVLGQIDLAHWTQVSDRCPLGYLFSVVIDPILFKLAGNEDMHNILDEFEFWPDLTTDYRVSCP